MGAPRRGGRVRRLRGRVRVGRGRGLAGREASSYSSGHRGVSNKGVSGISKTGERNGFLVWVLWKLEGNINLLGDLGHAFRSTLLDLRVNDEVAIPESIGDLDLWLLSLVGD